MEFATVIHLCACGCGNKVVTPLKRAGWELSYTEDGVSLYPSIGCWSFACRSHYWVRQNQVVWSDDWSNAEIRNGREETQRMHLDHQRRAKSQEEENNTSTHHSASAAAAEVVVSPPSKTYFRRVLEVLQFWK
ncbi:DUF6527 family protein [Prosthecobacter sp.]|uniref:DUF6527 family protein n=1 Tax=Prosthecobacter sp. TaxID=1965333 RepID=UPI0037831BCC